MAIDRKQPGDVLQASDWNEVVDLLRDQPSDAIGAPGAGQTGGHYYPMERGPALLVVVTSDWTAVSGQCDYPAYGPIYRASAKALAGTVAWCLVAQDSAFPVYSPKNTVPIGEITAAVWDAATAQYWVFPFCAGGGGSGSGSMGVG